MKISSARFIGAASTSQSYPRLPHPEIAFAGRSNVGKSSLLNTLVERKRLARISATPGRTRQIIFFLVNESFAFADLPGYGYAKVSRALRASWAPLMEDYLRQRENLRGVVIIMDLRRGMEKEDLALCEFLTFCRRPHIVVATKIDKLNRTQRMQRLALLSTQLVDDQRLIPFSARTGEGKEELWREIGRMIKHGLG